MMRRRLASLTLAVAACSGEDVPEPAVLGELCGDDQPVRLLALEPDLEVSGPIHAVGDLRLLVVGRPVAEGPVTVLADPVLWATGPCGEDPRPVAEDVEAVLRDEHWPDVVLGCRKQARDIVALDLTGATAPHVAFADIECPAWATTEGFVGLSERPDGSVAAMLHPYPADVRSETSTPRVLLDQATAQEFPLTLEARLRVIDETVFVLARNGALLRLELATESVTVEQTGVHDYRLSTDGRWLLWQDLQVADDPEHPEGALFLRDRTTGAGQVLAQTQLEYNTRALTHVEFGVVSIQLPGGILRVYFLPGLDFVDLPSGVLLRERLPDGRWLVQHGWTGPIARTELREVATAAPFFAHGRLVAVEPDGVLMADVQPNRLDDEGPLWFAPFDGSTPVRLAEDVSSYFTVDRANNRLITRLNQGLDGLGDLVVVDYATGSERLVDRGVAFWSYWGIDGDLLRYTVRDGERSGVWLARLPAP